MTAEHCRSRRGGWRRGRQWAGKKERERRDRLVGKNKKPKICMSCRRTRGGENEETHEGVSFSAKAFCSRA